MAEKEERKFDDVLVELGEFGRYQIWIYNLMCIFIFMTAWHMMSYIFLSGEADHWCKIPEWESVDCTSYGFNTSRECALGKREVGIPWNNSDDGQMEKMYSTCTRYNTTNVNYNPDLNLQGSDAFSCNAGWVYDSFENGEKTVEQDFNLVCGSEYYVSLSHSIFFVGVAAGSLTMGMISDRFGRHRTLFVCLGALGTFGVALAFSTNYWMFTILRMFTGVFMNGMLQASFVLANEMIGPSKRAVSGNVIWICYASGYMLLSLISFYIRNWRHVQLIVSAVPLFLFITIGIVPESPRWLMSRGRVKEATKIMRKLGKINGADIKETFNMDNVVSDEKPEKGDGAKKESVIDLFRMPRLRLYILNLMFQLCINTMVYYGVSLSTGSLGVNKYIAFAIAAAVEIPACYSVVRPIEMWGRRPVYIFFMVLCGVAILSTIFIPYGIGRTTVAMVGKFAITASFCIVYLHSCEIIPTPVRNVGLGLCTLCSNMSNIFTPPILLLTKIWDPLPLVIFGVIALIGGATAYLLPETRGKKIPETMEEGENIGWKKAPRRRSPSVKYSNIEYHKAGEAMGEPV